MMEMDGQPTQPQTALRVTMLGQSVRTIKEQCGLELMVVQVAMMMVNGQP